eukprot:TRINITY_DN67550_c4_g2_i1.p2 TRINITY_DN67550_c4_g2~~TRINITY_DN67550_c4_g2_i1.p2  ORF type:complete len:112 (-),score=1.02 TRINITY_DN67550_c4_g2_i1:1059-1394(-)
MTVVHLNNFECPNVPPCATEHGHTVGLFAKCIITWNYTMQCSHLTSGAPTHFFKSSETTSTGFPDTAATEHDHIVCKPTLIHGTTTNRWCCKLAPQFLFFLSCFSIFPFKH